MDESMNAAELAAQQLRAEAVQKVDAAEATVEEGRKLIAQGERRVAEGEDAVVQARMELKAAEDFIAKLLRRLEAEPTADAVATPATPTKPAPAAADSAPSATVNGGRSMIPVMEEMMSDGEWHTIDGFAPDAGPGLQMVARVAHESPLGSRQERPVRETRPRRREERIQACHPEWRQAPLRVGRP